MKRIDPQVSIVGMASELAGPANSLANFYQVIINNIDATSMITPDRWKVDLQTLPPSILRGGFLQRDPWLFDHQFFSITPKEAARMDPQHRMLLENTYHAFEDAHINPVEFKGQHCGVFIGLATQDYSRLMHGSGDFPGLHAKGSLGCMAAGRISYHFDFIGPSLVIDTACSSSLVALHQAVKALQNQECDLAVVGGSSLILTTDYSLDLANAGMLAKDGRCKAFSHLADGFGRGEGIAVIILQRHEDALKAKRRIYANLLGSAINCDGESNGITAPSKESQQRVLKEALRNAQLNPEEVIYIETHGTGTNLGDKIEYSALGHVYQGRPTPLYMGSVKGNIAHSEAAAGLAGVIKASLCIYNGKIPPHAMADSINGDLLQENFNVIFPRETLDHKNIVASVSSFGMSGANACVLLGPAETRIRDLNEQHQYKPKVSVPFLLLSAKSPEAMAKLGQEYRTLLADMENAAFKNTLDHANLSRRHFTQYRSLIHGNNPQEFLDCLNKVLGEATPKVSARKRPKITFLFTGQGASYPNMTKSLYDKVTLYRSIFDKYAAILDAEVSLPQKISYYIFNETTPLIPSDESARVEQLSLFLVEFSLAELLSTLGIKPSFVVGHSLGEYAAACCAGILTFRNAIQMISERALAIDHARKQTEGVMVQVLGSAETVETLLKELQTQSGDQKAWISAYNAPEIHVVSGTVQQMDLLLNLLKRRRIPSIKLNTRYAFHTPLFTQAAAEFRKALLARKLDFPDSSKSETGFISTVEEQEPIKGHPAFQDPCYWEAQITKPVQFSRAINACYQNGSTYFIELGPDFILGNLASQCLKSLDKDRSFEFIPVQTRKNQKADAFFELLLRLYRHELLDLSKLSFLCNEAQPGKGIVLPSYPFTRVQLIPDYLKSQPGILEKQGFSAAGPKLEPLEMAFQIKLDLNNLNDAYLGQHVIHTTPVVPGSYYVESALSIFEKMVSHHPEEGNFSAIEIRNLSILSPLTFADTDHALLNVVVKKEKTHYQLTFVNPANEDALVCELSIFLVSTAPDKVKSLPIVATEKKSTQAFYQTYADRGVTYGPDFKLVQSYCALADKKTLGEIPIPVKPEHAFSTRVIFLDNCFHVIALCLNSLDHAYAPVSIAEYTCYSRACPESIMRCYAEITAETPGRIEANLAIYNAQQELVVEIRGIRCQKFDLKKSQGPILHEVSFSLVQDGAGAVTIQEPYSLVTDNPDLRNVFSAYKTPVPVLSGASHLVYALDSSAANSNSIFQLFSQFHDTLKKVDDQYPGKLKKVTLLACQNNRDTIQNKTLITCFMQAIALVYPTEFPKIDFRCFRYDVCTPENLGFIFGDLPDLTDPFFTAPLKVENNTLYCQKIVPLSIAEEPPLQNSMNTRDYYLVTGGLGGIGRQLISHMVINLGIRNLVITIRNLESLTKDKLRFLETLRNEYGATIICKTVDLTVESQVVEFFKEVPRPLCGIFHLAGINIDLPLGKITPDLLEPVLATKLYSAWKLHELSLSINELKYFVLFSSMAAQVSSPGQFSYALANLGLGELARYRAEQQLPVTVIDWGPWKETGMMTRITSGSNSSAAFSDFEALEPLPCLNALFTAITQLDQSHVAVFKTSKKSRFNKRPLAQVTSGQEKSVPLPSSFSSLKDAATCIKQLLITLISQETSYAPSDVDENSLLSELGIDSINTIRIRSELQTTLNLQIPMTILLDTPSVSSIVQQLADLWMKNQGAPLEGGARNTEEPALIPEEEIADFSPLSHNQFSIWYEQQAVENNTAYHCSLGWKINGGPIALEKLQQAWESTLKSQEMLRSVITEREGEIGYRILPLTEALQQQVIHVETLDDHLDFNKFVHEKLTRTIDFYNELPTRLYIFHHKKSVYFILASHHIIMDATSIFILGDILLRALCATPDFQELPPIGATYHEFVKHQRLQTDQFKENASNFLFNQAFDENSELLHFELPKHAKTGGAPRGSSVRIKLSTEETQTMMALPVNMRAPVCLSAWALLLARYSGEDRIQVGVGFNGRPQAKWSNTIGHFINVLPLQLPVDQHDNGVHFLTTIRERLLQLIDFQEFSLSQFLAHDKVKRALHHGNLLQTAFNYFDASRAKIEIDNPALEIESYLPAQQEAQFEISLWVTREAEEYVFDIKYRSDLLAEGLVKQLADHYRHVVLSLSTMLLKNDLRSPLTDIKLLSPSEELRMLKNEAVPHSHSATVYDYFVENVHKNPSAIALELKNKKVTYQELSNYVEELANHLALSSQPEKTVAILTPERATLEFVIVVLLLWKQGYAYLPLNTRHPADRIKYMIDTVGCKTILNIDHDLSPTLRDYLTSIDDSFVADIALENNVLTLKTIQNSLKPFADVLTNNQQSGLAYVLFTSGSTGVPKGVLIEHQGLIDRLLWMKDYFNFSSSDKFLQSTLLTFDPSLLEFCLPLICGGTCVLFHSQDGRNAHAEICKQNKVTMMIAVPSLFSVLQEDLSECSSLRHIILGGEVLPSSIVNQWLQTSSNATLYNVYGPTEATILATCYACRTPIEPSSSVPIGFCCNNVTALVLDRYGNLVPRGVTGELYLAGEGIACGYLGAKSNPFANNPYQALYARIYKTGDYVRWLPDGNLEYLGRKDNRVKLNGLLIELGEIEQLVLQGFPDITNAAALIVDLPSDDRNTRHIVLCLMSTLIDTQPIYEHLKDHLPHYMLPWKIVVYPDFPRNSSHKIDRKALQVLVQNACQQTTAAQQARTVTEAKVSLSPLEAECVQIWKKLLLREQISLNDNFFDLGGDSLLLTKMILLVEKRLAMKINFARFLLNPTINAILNGINHKSIAWDQELSITKDIPDFQHSKVTNATLLTGATGHLGIHLLHQMLEHTEKEIFVIIRADSEEHARARLKSRYQEVFSRALDFSRIKVYNGDLSQPNFSLDEKVFSNLCQSISSIVHAAAEVNHAVDYVRLKASNVIAAQNILQLGQLSHCSNFVYISTQFSEIDYLPEHYLENESLNKLCSGYEQSKFVTELQMKSATQLGYPITTLRLPLIFDGFDPALLTQNHFVSFFIKCLSLGSYPDSDISFDMLPTEEIAHYVVQLSKEISPKACVYNCLQYSLKLSDLFDYFNNSLSFNLTKLDFSAWQDLVIQATGVNDPFYRLLPLYTTEASLLLGKSERLIHNHAYLKTIDSQGEITSQTKAIKKICEFLANIYQQTA